MGETLLCASCALPLKFAHRSLPPPLLPSSSPPPPSRSAHHKPNSSTAHRSQHSRHHIHTHTHTHTHKLRTPTHTHDPSSWISLHRFPVLQLPHRLAQQLLHTHCSPPSPLFEERPSAITAMSSSSTRMQSKLTSKTALDSTPSTVTLKITFARAPGTLSWSPTTPFYTAKNVGNSLQAKQRTYESTQQSA